jgi:hypothetical protein
MNTELKRLAARRAELVAHCASQRVDAAQEFRALAIPVSAASLRGYLGSHMTTTLAVAGAVLGLLATRPKRAITLVSAGMSLWKLARKVLPLLSQAPH